MGQYIYIYGCRTIGPEQNFPPTLKRAVKNKNFVNSGRHSISQEPNMRQKGKNRFSITIEISNLDPVSYINDFSAGFGWISASLQKLHSVKSVQTRSHFWSVFSPKTGKYGPKITPYLDTFHAAQPWQSRLFQFVFHLKRIPIDRQYCQYLKYGFAFSVFHLFFQLN